MGEMNRVVTQFGIAVVLCLGVASASHAASGAAVAKSAVTPIWQQPAAQSDSGLHQAPLPSTALAGIALLSITAAHSFGRRKRRRA
jgi:hypothetical protein